MSQRRARQRRIPQQARASSPRKSWLRDWKVIGSAVGGALLVAALAIGLFVVRGTGSAKPLEVKAPSSGGGLSLAGTDPITGTEVSLASFRGKPVVLNIWASWCTGCRAEARDLARFAKDHPEAQVVGLDTQDSSGPAKAFYREFGWTHPSIEDKSGATAARLALQGLPTTLFIDARGRIVSRIVGASNYAGFTQGLRAAKNA